MQNTKLISSLLVFFIVACVSPNTMQSNHSMIQEENITINVQNISITKAQNDSPPNIDLPVPGTIEPKPKTHLPLPGSIPDISGMPVPSCLELLKNSGLYADQYDLLPGEISFVSGRINVVIKAHTMNTAASIIRHLSLNFTESRFVESTSSNQPGKAYFSAKIAKGKEFDLLCKLNLNSDVESVELELIRK